MPVTEWGAQQMMNKQINLESVPRKGIFYFIALTSSSINWKENYSSNSWGDYMFSVETTKKDGNVTW